MQQFREVSRTRTIYCTETHTTTGNGVGASSWEIRTGIVSKSVTLWTPLQTCIWAHTECPVCDRWSIFPKCFEQSTSWCFGSHFFVARVPSIHCHLPLSFSGFNFKKEKHGKKLHCQLFTAKNWSTLARHALKLICQTTFDSILFKSLLSHAGQLSCHDVTEVTWPKPGIFSCRRRSCTKRGVCFHSKQYFTYLSKMLMY